MRWFGFLIRITLLLAVVLALAAQPGTVQIAWHDVVIETSAALLTVGVLVVAFAFYMLFRIWRFLLDGPRFWRLRQKLKKQTDGQNFLTRALAAIAAGDAVEAGRLAVSARRLLGPHPTARLAQAQAAQLAGDTKAAQEIYTGLSQDPDSCVLGYRGLITAALRRNDWSEAERLTKRLRVAKPQTPWLSLIGYVLATHRQDWSEAQKALNAAQKARLIDTTRANPALAALLLAQSENEPTPEKSLAKAEQAFRLAPQSLPALLRLATLQSQTGHPRAALRLIERAWATQQHPDLARLYGTLGKGGLNPLQAYQHIENLTRATADSFISQWSLAEAALAADLWGAARRHLMTLAQRADATQGVFRLLAKLERREHGDDQAASAWLLRLGQALPDPRWLCQQCGGAQDQWTAHCPACGSFNALDWKIPGTSSAPAHPFRSLLTDLS